MDRGGIRAPGDQYDSLLLRDNLVLHPEERSVTKGEETWFLADEVNHIDRPAL